MASMQRAILRLLLVAVFALLSSCRAFSPDGASYAPWARLILYMHTESGDPPDISFTISEMSVQDTAGVWHKVAGGPFDINSLKLASTKQVLLTEDLVRPGSYKALKLAIDKAWMEGRAGRVSLALPQPDKEVVVKAGFDLVDKDSFLVSLLWRPEDSVEQGYRFQPFIQAEAQELSARGLLLFISNSGSDYISIIDRGIERVIAAVTVGDRPLGMALNGTEDLLYVVAAGARSIAVVDAAQFRVRSRIPLPAGAGPTDVVFMPDTHEIEGELYVINSLSNDVTVVSTLSRRMIKTIPVGNGPSAILGDRGRREVYVANALSNSLTIISSFDNSVAATVPVGIRPGGIADGGDRLYVINEGSNDISMVSKSLRKVIGAIPMVDRPKRALRGFDGRLFVLSSKSNSVTFINSQNVATRTVPAGRGPAWAAADEKRNRLYITGAMSDTVSVLDPIGERFIKELYVGKGPYGAVILDR
ncbi:MAG: hypothetical protein HY887_05795 [Deltaproteobacteria bacterium]|nr:hypothetical protein [Deltaproteobacteria bacterium]